MSEGLLRELRRLAGTHSSEYARYRFRDAADEIERLLELLRGEGANRYWEGRWRDADAEVERLRTENAHMRDLAIEANSALHRLVLDNERLEQEQKHLLVTLADEIDRRDQEIERLRAGFGPGLIQELRDKIERLRAGLRRLSEQDYDAGYSPEDYARAVLDGHEPDV